MEFVDSMDDRESTPSREWTEITPINAVFSHPIGFEVRRQTHVFSLIGVCNEVLATGLFSD
jgi:hypothetical protein